MDNLYEIYLEQAKLMHQNPKYWKGHMIKKYMPQIEEVIKEHKIDTNSILDYGCGKAQHHPENWNAYKYDPAFPKYEKKPEYFMSAMWINYQKQYDFNPPHDHDGKLSFVIYLSIPEKLKKENKAYIGNSCGPGGIQIMYGEGPRGCITNFSHFPEEGDMLIFPAWIKHWVSPYKSDCVRVSVSGNIHDSAQLNNIEQHVKEK